MARPLPLAAVLLALPLCAQGSERHFIFGVQQLGPTFEASFEGIQDGKPVLFDSKADLKLDKDKTGFGVIAEYQGPRFAVEFMANSQDYKGSSIVNRKITISGQDYSVGAKVDSTLALKSYTFNWTIRVIKGDYAWIGLDLGARVWEVDLKAMGQEPFTGIKADAQFKYPIPIPQIGGAVGFQVLGGRVVAKGYYHLLTYKSATYKHFGADVRAYPLKWLGLRAFVDNETFDVPKGSVNDDMKLKIDHSGVGFGAVIRF